MTIRLAALVPYPIDTTPSQRFRIEQWVPLLEQDGIQVDFFPFADEELFRQLHSTGSFTSKAIRLSMRFASRIGDIVRSRGYDAVLVHRSLSIAGPALLETILERVGPPVIFDFDDAIFLEHTTDANREWGWLKFPRKTETICRLSDHVVVGNSFLGDYARQFNAKVTIVPTSVDTSRYRVRSESHSRNGHSPLVVGWTGSSTSQTYLEWFAPVLRELVSRAGIEFRVHSNRKPELSGIPFEWRPWSPESEVEEISQFDVGIMPMPDTDWARGKCAMKALLYMSVGVPAIGSDIGANRDVITNGVNGFLASTKDDWIAQTMMLMSDPSLRDSLAAEGRKTVEKSYSMERSANLFAAVVRDTLTRQ
jgi:glycosyltransferase involved in cell wall biosynthesis